jgi:hypothetical protein
MATLISNIVDIKAKIYEKLSRTLYY